MQQALSLAQKAMGSVSPNPAVGAVIVSNGRVVGEGYTQPPGSDHAEIVALKQAGEAARGGTMYVTLEPCGHQGRTPPCTEFIISSGIAEVHMAMLDPNPLVAGKGMRRLESTGIRTSVGERENEAGEVVEAYVKFITTGLPFVVAKFAMSLDGKIATRKFDSKWISNEWSRNYVHQLRRESDAIMVGVNTVLKDDPQLTARNGEGIRQPLRVIVDSRGQTPVSAKVFESPGKALIATTRMIDLAQTGRYANAGIETALLTTKNERVDIDELLKYLGRKEITSVLVEGGGTLLGTLFDRRLVDKVFAFIAPIIIGGQEAVSPVAGEGVESVALAPRLSRIRVERFGDDIMVSGYIK